MKMLIGCPECENTDLECDIDGFECKCGASFDIEDCTIVNVYE